MSERLTVNGGSVVHETIDGETIVIDLATGAYYSFDGVGADVWQLLVECTGTDELARILAGRYEAEAEVLDEAVRSFVAELLHERLLTAAPNGSDGVEQASNGREPRASNGPESHPANGVAAEGITKAEFAAPVLHKYTDMQEFMLVDPLHDVEVDAGWPHVRAG